MRFIILLILSLFMGCENKFEQDAIDAEWKSTDDTPTGRVLTYELSDKNYTRDDAREIAKILLQKECESYPTQSIRVVLNDKFGNSYGILGLNCESDKYFGGLTE